MAKKKQCGFGGSLAIFCSVLCSPEEYSPNLSCTSDHYCFTSDCGLCSSTFNTTFIYVQVSLYAASRLIFLKHHFIMSWAFSGPHYIVKRGEWMPLYGTDAGGEK